MRKDAIEAVAQAIQGLEIDDLGFTGEAYIAKRSERPLLDKSGHDRPWVGDIAAYTLALYTFDGQPRAKRLDVEGIRAVLEQAPITIMEIVARIFGIHEDTARELLAPEHYDWRDMTPEIAVDVLVDLYHTGDVHWPRPMTGFLGTLNPEQLDRVLRGEVQDINHGDRAFAQYSTFAALYSGKQIPEGTNQ